MPGSPFPDADDSQEAADESRTSGPPSADSSSPSNDGHDTDPRDLGFDIPDDASALESDRLRYLDEQARGVGRADGPDWSVREPGPGLPTWFQTRRWHKYGLSGPLVIAVLLAVAIVGSLMTVLRPDVSSAPTALPLSEPVAGAANGTVGGLMPEAVVTLDGVPLSLRRLRPAVVIVASETCSTCGDVIADVSAQARDLQLRTLLVGDPAQLDQLRTLSREAALGNAGVVLDTQGVLTAQYPGPGPTLLLVHADGIIGDVIRDPTTTARLGPALAQLARPGAGTRAA